MDDVVQGCPGWVTFGTHAADVHCDYAGPLEFGGNRDHMPEYERHAGEEGAMSRSVARRLAVMEAFR